MSKLYISTLALALVATSAMAQSSGNERPLKRVKQSEVRNTRPTPVPSNRDIIWEDDFSVPGNWVIAHDPGTFDIDWQIGVGLENTGTFQSATIESTTYANGCAMIDSDAANNTSGNPESAHITTASPIDLSGSNNVLLTFESYFRSFPPNACYAVISTNGVDWPALTTDTASWSSNPNVFILYPDVAGNQATDNPETVSLNISAIAGGQPQVWVRFHYTAAYSYTWFVDDVRIESQPDNELIVNYAFLSSTGLGDEFGRIPANQLEPSMNVGAGIENFGILEQTNVVVVMEVRDENDNIAFSQTSNLGTLLPGATSEMNELVDLPTLTEGLYTGTFTVTSDQSGADENPDNNVFLRTFEVNNDLFSLDGIGNHPAGYERLDALGSGSFPDDPQGMILFTYYQLATDANVYGIQVELSNQTTAGSFIFVSVYDTATVGDPAFDQLLNQTLASTTDPRTITSADLQSGVVNVLFDEPLSLAPGGYYAAVSLYQEGTNDVYILDDITVTQPAGDAAIYSPADARIYGNGNAHAVRLILDPTTSINETADLEGITMFPNPTNGILRITSTKSEKYNVEVLNVVGEKVMTNVFTGNTVLDLDRFAAGVYNVRVSNGTQSTVQRITLN